jgi:hypothetical protein
MKGGGGRAMGGLFGGRSNKNDGTTAAVGGAVAGTALSGATGTSTPILMGCAADDTTFMCKLARFFNTVKMIIGLIVIFVLIILVIWFAYKWYKSR